MYKGDTDSQWNRSFVRPRVRVVMPVERGVSCPIGLSLKPTVLDKKKRLREMVF